VAKKRDGCLRRGMGGFSGMGCLVEGWVAKKTDG
jgi:hypothetical protein